MSTYALNMNKDMNKVIVCLVSLLSVNAVDPKAAVDSKKNSPVVVESVKSETPVVEHGNNAHHAHNEHHGKRGKHNRKNHHGKHNSKHGHAMHKLAKKHEMHEMHKDAKKHEMHKNEKHEMHKAHKKSNMHAKVATKEVATQTEK